MKITSDWHIHSANSCDGASLAVADLVREVPAVGIRDFGLTDHVHTPLNLPDIQRSRADFEACAATPRFHFGVEVSCVSRWELDRIADGAEASAYGIRTGGPAGTELAIGLTATDVETYGIEYVVGGTHWPMYVPMEREQLIRDYHRQNMFLASHPLVDVVAHPWWWHGHWQDEDGRYTDEPWLGDFDRIPASMHREFAAAARQADTCIEINLDAMLLGTAYPERFRRRYVRYLAELKENGAQLCMGSDCHASHYEVNLGVAAQMLDEVGITDRDLWTMDPRG